MNPTGLPELFSPSRPKKTGRKLEKTDFKFSKKTEKFNEYLHVSVNPYAKIGLEGLNTVFICFLEVK